MTKSKPSPGFFEGDTVAHCGPTSKCEFAPTLNLTDLHTGWVFTRTVRNNAHAHILGALKARVDEILFQVSGLDFDNGTEFLNKAVSSELPSGRSSSPDHSPTRRPRRRWRRSSPMAGRPVARP